MRRRTDAPERLLATVLFTDIVGSTELAAKMGDREWRQLLARHHAYVRKVLKRHRGREVDTAGDGFFATFDQPARAIKCAEELVQGLHDMGIDIRAGVHMGEVETMGPKVGGIAVHIGSRVMSKAGTGEVLVSNTVRDLMSGSDVKFDDRGVHEWNGVPAQWHLYSVSTEAPPKPAEPIRAEPERERRLSSRTLIGLGAGSALLVAAVVVFATRGGGGGFVIAPNTVVRIDPASGEVVGGANVGTQPIQVAFGEGSVWVANFGARTVQRIDPQTSEASAAFGGLSGNPTGMAVGGGFAWVTSSFTGTLSKIDPDTNLSQPIDVGVGARGVAFGEDAVWVLNNVKGTVVRISSSTLSSETISLPDGAAPEGIAVGGGSVWVADSLGNRVYRIDPQANRVVGTGTPLLRGHPAQLAFGEGYVWVSNTSDDSVTRIDPRTGEGVTVERVGNGPTGIAAGVGGVWVANSLDGTVARIDPEAARVVGRTRIGFTPDGVAVGGGAVWVSVRSA